MNVTRLLASRGLVLCILGFLLFIPSYFLLPFVITKGCNEIFCPSLKTPTVGDFLGNSFTSPPAPWQTLVTIVPLFMAVAMLLLGLLYTRQQRHLVLHWFLGGEIVGFISLLALLIFASIAYYPFIGFFGLVLGYALFFAGYRTFLAESPSRIP